MDDAIRRRAQELAAEAQSAAFAKQRAWQLAQEQEAQNQAYRDEKSRVIADICAQYVDWLRRNRVAPVLVYEWPRKKKAWYIGTHRIYSHREAWDRENAEQRSYTVALDEALFVDKRLRICDRKANSHEYHHVEQQILMEIIATQVAQSGRPWP